MIAAQTTRSAEQPPECEQCDEGRLVEPGLGVCTDCCCAALALGYSLEQIIEIAAGAQ